MCTIRNHFSRNVLDKMLLHFRANFYIRDSFFLLAIGFLAITLACCASPENRIALVIGNQYIDSKNLESLGKQPIEDAKKIIEALEASNFNKIIPRYNLNRDEMLHELEKFINLAADADAAFFYFSGHGVQEQGKNYLFPVDTFKNKNEQKYDSNEKMLDKNTISLDRVLVAAQQEKGKENRVNIFVLDACRNSGYSNSPRGLAKTEESGILIAFAASPGQIAMNDGVYALKLSQIIQEDDGLLAQEIFDKLQREIKLKTYNTEHPRTPIYSPGLYKDFYFIKKKHARLVFSY